MIPNGGIAPQWRMIFFIQVAVIENYSSSLKNHMTRKAKTSSNHDSQEKSYVRMSVRFQYSIKKRKIFENLSNIL